MAILIRICVLSNPKYTTSDLTFLLFTSQFHSTVEIWNESVTVHLVVGPTCWFILVSVKFCHLKSVPKIMTLKIPIWSKFWSILLILSLTSIMGKLTDVLEIPQENGTVNCFSIWKILS